MPQIFKIGNYIIFFWSNETIPLEPIHVHVALDVPSDKSTKIWITQTGKCLLANNESKIPNRQLKYIIDVIEARSKEIINKWINYFGSISYYC